MPERRCLARTCSLLTTFTPRWAELSIYCRGNIMIHEDRIQTTGRMTYADESPAHSLLLYVASCDRLLILHNTNPINQ